MEGNAHEPGWRRITTLLTALLAAAFLTLAASPAQADGHPSGHGWVRVTHLAPHVGTADVHLRAGAHDLLLGSVGYGQVSAYRRVPSGRYTVYVVPAGASTSHPLLTASVRIAAGSAYTVAAVGRQTALHAVVLEDSLSAPPAGMAKIRVLSGSTAPSGIDADVVGAAPLATSLGFGKATGYTSVPQRAWTLHVHPAGHPARTSAKVKVSMGSVYTLIVVNGSHGVRLEPVLDSAGAQQTPQGGFDTGGGGLARLAQRSHHASDQLLWAGIAALLVLCAAGGTTRARLRLVRRPAAAHRR